MKDEEKMEGEEMKDEEKKEEEDVEVEGFLFNSSIRHLRLIKKPPAHQHSGYSQFREAS